MGSRCCGTYLSKNFNIKIPAYSVMMRGLLHCVAGDLHQSAQEAEADFCAVYRESLMTYLSERPALQDLQLSFERVHLHVEILCQPTKVIRRRRRDLRVEYEHDPHLQSCQVRIFS